MKKKFSRILGVVATITLLASFLAVPVAADVSEADVNLDNVAGTGSEISADASYVITFDINDELLVDGTDWIEIRFPEGTILDDAALADADITVQTESTFGNDNAATLVGLESTFTEGPDDVWTVNIDIDDLPLAVSENSDVRVEFVDETLIENPDEAGIYTLEVRTSDEDEWVESEEYEIEVPDVDVLPGIVELYNPADILMDSDTGAGALQAMITAAGDGWTVKIGEGEYTEDPNTAETNVTIEGSGDVEDIVIIGDWDIDHTDITIDNLTLDGDGAALVIDVTANDFTIQNCVLEDAATALIDDDGSAVDNPTIIDNCTFNIEDEIGVDVGTAAIEITDSTFNLIENGDGVCIELNADAEVTNCTFTGDSGTGVQVIAGDSEISGSTFDGLEIAFDINTGTADINTNTIQNTEGVAIDVAACTLVAIHNNTFTGNDEAALIAVALDAEDVFIMFNTITDNAGDSDLLIDNNDAGVDLECRNNWWGDADGPGDDAFSDDVESEPFLPGPISNSAIQTAVAFGDTASFEDICGVEVDNDDAADAVEIIGAAQYTANPVDIIDDAVGYWDVCVIDDGDVDQVTIRLYTDVTDTTEVWVWGAARGEWLEASAATPNLFGGFMSIVVDADSTPTIDDLGALPFVVVEPGEGTEDAPVISAPDVGAVDVSVTPTLAWLPVDDATYEIQIAQDATFAILDEAATSPTNAYIVTTALAEGQSYYWRVRGVTDAGAGDWATGVFTTATPEPEPTPPITIEPAPPAPEITVTLPTPTVTQAIDPGLLWAIIGVGAVLVISLIVLIVRTRRAV